MTLTDQPWKPEDIKLQAMPAGFAGLCAKANEGSLDWRLLNFCVHKCYLMAVKDLFLSPPP